MARDRELNEAKTERGNAGTSNAMRPMNDLERLEADNEKLRAVNREQEVELLQLYRRIHGQLF